MLSKQQLGLRLVKYPSGLLVLQCDSFKKEEVAKQTLALIKKLGDATANQLALQLGISTTLARQRLLDCEESGLACRDESIQGLSFYPNLFIFPEK